VGAEAAVAAVAYRPTIIRNGSRHSACDRCPSDSTSSGRSSLPVFLSKGTPKLIATNLGREKKEMMGEANGPAHIENLYI
jgi:hypothetical protein